MTTKEMELAARQISQFYHILSDVNRTTGVRRFPKEDALRIAGSALGIIVADIRREAAEKASTDGQG